MSYKIKQTKGFTLVELSIVIIIIGFLIAGVSAGNSLIQSAKLNAVINEMTNYHTAYITFNDRYNAVPGDMPNASSYWPNCTPNSVSYCNGNGNGMIELDGNWALFAIAPTMETYLAWRELLLAGMINNGGTATNIDLLNSANTFSLADIGTSPASAFPNGTYYISGMYYAFYPQGAAISPWGSNNQSPNILYLIGQQFQNGGYYKILTPTQAATIDQKADDGNPLTGTWRGVNDARDCFNGQCECLSGSSYKFTFTQPACVMGKSLD
jgi:prepilin-type N-terminal cleavage/methylation domain-containing protein